MTPKTGDIRIHADRNQFMLQRYRPIDPAKKKGWTPNQDWESFKYYPTIEDLGKGLLNVKTRERMEGSLP